MLRGRIRFSQALGAFAAAAIAVLASFGGASTPASAQQTLGALIREAPPTQLSDGFRGALTEMNRAMWGNDCLGGSRIVMPIAMAFVGVPQNTIHLDTIQIATINTRAKQAVDSFGIFNALSTDTLSTIAAFSGNNDIDRLALEKAVSQIKGAPLVFVITATRPAPKLAQLKLELFARRDDGVRACPKSVTFLVDLDDYVIVSSEQLPRYEPYAFGFVENKWAMAEAIRRAARIIPDYEEVRLKVETQMEGSCTIKRFASTYFQNAYFEQGEAQTQSFTLGEGEWPGLIEPTDDFRRAGGAAGSQSDGSATDQQPDKKSAVLQLEVSLDEAYTDSYFLTFRVKDGNRTRRTVQFGVIITPQSRSGCRAIARDLLTRLVNQSAVSGASFELRPSQPSFRVAKDEVEVLITPKRDQYFYCWVIAPDQTAYVLLPWKNEMLIEPFKGGETITYPTDFLKINRNDGDGLQGPTVYPRAAREVFGCFASDDRPPEDLEDRWISLHYMNEGGAAPQKALSGDQIQRVLEDWRALPGVEEYYAWLVATP